MALLLFRCSHVTFTWSFITQPILHYIAIISVRLCPICLILKYSKIACTIWHPSVIGSEWENRFMSGWRDFLVSCRMVQRNMIHHCLWLAICIKSSILVFNRNKICTWRERETGVTRDKLMGPLVIFHGNRSVANQSQIWSNLNMVVIKRLLILFGIVPPLLSQNTTEPGTTEATPRLEPLSWETVSKIKEAVWQLYIENPEQDAHASVVRMGKLIKLLKEWLNHSYVTFNSGCFKFPGLKIFTISAFHDCVGDACDGCVNFEVQDNVGLLEALELLEPVYSGLQLKGSISRADFWQLAAITGIEYGVEINNRRCSNKSS